MGPPAWMTRMPTRSQIERQTASNEAIRWFLRLREPACSPEEKRMFEEWLNCDALHRREYRIMEALWDRLEPAETRRPRQTGGGSAPGPRRRTSRKARSGVRRAAGLVTALLVLALAAAWWWEGWRVTAVSFQTAKGEQRTITLPDGTIIDVNTDTAGTARLWGGGRRIVLDRGEAYFNVVSDPDRPFEVLVDGSRIQDIGTEFVVRKESAQVSVAVVSGAVRIDLPPALGTPAEHHSKFLRPGERIAYTREGAWTTVERIDPAAVTAWRTGMVAFDGITLGEAIAEVSRYRPERITLVDPTLAGTPIKGIFTIRNLDEFFLALPTIVPVEIARRPGHIIISRK